MGTLYILYLVLHGHRNYNFPCQHSIVYNDLKHMNDLMIGFILDLLEEIWLHNEGYSDSYSSAILDQAPQDIEGQSSKKIYAKVIELLSTYNSVKELFAERLSQPETEKEGDLRRQEMEMRLSCFDDIIENLVLLNSSTKLECLFHPERSHFFALKILGFMITSLDCMIYLQSRFHFQEAMLKLQAECQHDNNIFIIDQNSVKRNQILVQSYLLGGPNDRKVPLDTLTEV